MSDQGKPYSLLRRWLKHPFSTPLSESRAAYDDIIRQATQTQSLDELLHRFPERICAALELATFHLFILEQDHGGRHEYRLLNPASRPMVFPASSATVARMKRERRPSLFVPAAARNANPEAWQLLATPEELEILNALDTQLLFPLEGRTRLMGFISMSRAAHRPFSRAELQFLRDLGPQMGRGLETALLLRRLSHQAVERDRSLRELAVAREVQENLLPRDLPQPPGIQLAAFYQSAEQVGGDYYDAFLTANGSLCLVIGDVSGKGVPAALLMAALRASLHALMLQPDLSVSEMLHQLNGLLFQSSSASRYATLFLCLYHPSTQTLEYSNAGHNPPLLVRADRSVERLTDGGTVIGLFPQTTLDTRITPFGAGDTLVTYTDGITEAVNAAGTEWSEHGLQSALLASDLSGAASVMEHLRAAVANFTAGTPPSDDMTLLVLTR